MNSDIPLNMKMINKTKMHIETLKFNGIMEIIQAILGPVLVSRFFFFARGGERATEEESTQNTKHSNDSNNTLPHGTTTHNNEKQHPYCCAVTDRVVLVTSQKYSRPSISDLAVCEK